MDDLLEYAKSLGGQVVRSVDLDTGEIIGMRENALSSSGGGSLVGYRRVEASLSTFHNSPQITIRSGASLLKVKRTPKVKRESLEDDDMPKKEKAKRGKVAGFSAKSRNRLIRTVAEVKRDCLPVFVTLTYPAQFPNMAEVFKRDLDVFIKRLAREFPQISGVWKLEPQKRGAPHFHLLIWGVDPVQLKFHVPIMWYEVVGSGDIKHGLWHYGLLGNSHCVQVVHSQKQVFSYVSKYMSKQVSSAFSDWGRWWGVFFRERLPRGKVVNIQVTEQKAIEFIRYMRKYAHIKSRDYRTLTIICNPDVWLNKLL